MAPDTKNELLRWSDLTEGMLVDVAPIANPALGYSWIPTIVHEIEPDRATFGKWASDERGARVFVGLKVVKRPDKDAEFLGEQSGILLKIRRTRIENVRRERNLPL